MIDECLGGSHVESFETFGPVTGNQMSKSISTFNIHFPSSIQSMRRGDGGRQSQLTAGPSTSAPTPLDTAPDGHTVEIPSYGVSLFTLNSFANAIVRHRILRIQTQLVSRW